MDNAGNLYVAGGFALLGDVAASGVAQWDGSRWTSLGLGVSGAVMALAVSGTTLAVNMARWDGSMWSALGSGLGGAPQALVVSSNNLYVGGSFELAGGKISPYLARAWLPALPAMALARERV